MNAKHLTLDQCKRIIDNNYLGECRKNGKQTDYGDHIPDIDNQYWSILASKTDKYIQERSLAPELGSFLDLSDTEAEPSVKRLKIVINPWQRIAEQLSRRFS